eukprot:11129256-Karenia_brevis.AAC.1
MMCWALLILMRSRRSVWTTEPSLTSLGRRSSGCLRSQRRSRAIGSLTNGQTIGVASLNTSSAAYIA